MYACWACGYTKECAKGTDCPDCAADGAHSTMTLPVPDPDPRKGYREST